MGAIETPKLQSYAVYICETVTAIAIVNQATCGG